MTESRRVVITKFGPPEVMSIVTEELAQPGAGEVQMRHTAIGFNFVEINQRKGFYPLLLPTGLGFEAAGVVEAVGPGVTGIELGARVATMNAGLGTYSDRRNVLAEKLVTLPDHVSDEAAATFLLKGLTAQYLLHTTHAVQPGELLLVHSAAGGVGQILTRWATALGAKVIGATGSPHKKAAALAAGCTEVIDLNEPDWPQAFLKASGGRKARVVYDAVGKDTLLKSLDCTAPFGLVVSYGAASGKSPSIDPEMLSQKGGLFLTRPSVFQHNADPEALRAHAADLFGAIERGHVKVDVGQRFGLDQIVEVHRAVEERCVEGAILITP
jgi:NADPH:quinone reductase